MKDIIEKVSYVCNNPLALFVAVVLVKLCISF